MGILLTLVVQVSLVTISVAEYCPSRSPNETYVDYQVKYRFDRFRKAHPVMTVTHTHPRKDGETYTYTISFCAEKSGDAAVTQTSVLNNKSSVVGRVDQASVLTGGTDWILIQYLNGEPYGTHCKKQNRQSWILLLCEVGSRKEELRVIEEHRVENEEGNPDSGDLCYYLFEYNSKEICSPVKARLSAGAIFCIILFCVALAYLVFGFLYKRFVVGAKGCEQIPNFAFWRKVGNLSADGCDYVCRRQEHPNTYKGMADALDIDSSEDEKDDGLLPM